MCGDGEPMDRPIPHEEEHSETSAARRELPPEGHRGSLCAELARGEFRLVRNGLADVSSR